MARLNPESLTPLVEKELGADLLRKLASARFWLTFIVMGLTWIVLSGQFDAFHLSLGLISCLLVAYFSSDLLFGGSPSWARADLPFRFALYLPWLFLQIILANWHVLKLCFWPRLGERIDPRLVRFKSFLKKDLSLVTLANSITLTPGTITVRVGNDGEFIVHAIDSKSADLSALLDMERKVARAFREQP